MDGPDAATTIELLRRVGRDEPEAQLELLARLGADLRELARAHVQRASGELGVEPTVLVNEAWLRVAEREGLEFPDRRHFLAFVSRVMRNLVVDAARAKHAERRSTDTGRVSVADGLGMLGIEGRALELLDVDQALTRLAEHDEEAARIVELRFFGGLSHEEIGDVLGCSLSTVERRWRFARAWLRTELVD